MTLLLLATLTLLQTPEPPSYRAALERLAAHDTATALPLLREATRSAPQFGPGFLRLGSVLSARASENPKDFRERLEAERALQRAMRLLGEDPEVLLEFGLLLRKQQSRVDARRVLDRAWRAAERRGDSLPAAQRARMHYALGRIYETWWEEQDHLTNVSAVALAQAYCPLLDRPLEGHVGVATADALVSCPEKLTDVMAASPAVTGPTSEERERMLQHFRLALAADSAQVEAGLRLLGHLADGGEWGEYERLARGLARTHPDDGRVQLFLGLGLHERGLDRLADSVLHRAVALLPPSDRAPFEDLQLLLPPSAQRRYAAADSATRAEVARAFFVATDPLLLTPFAERRVEHYARVAWAELKFGAPEAGLHGWDTDRGRIWIRYGQPKTWLQCCFGERERQVIWSYGHHGPVFAFTRNITFRRSRFTVVAERLADALAEEIPEAYQPRTVTTVVSLPRQIARFRGVRPELTRVELYAQPPRDSLEVPAGGALEAGVFVFDPYYQPMWEHRAEIAADSGARVGYAFEVQPGTVRYGIEARAAGPDELARPVARVRDSVVAPGYPAGRLALSDLLLADRLDTRVERPARRADLTIRPSATLQFAAGVPVHLYFEVYGLALDTDSLANYAVALVVEDSVSGNVLARLARGVAELFSGGGRDVRVAFERTVRPVEDRAIDYLTLELRAGRSGNYVVRVEVTDRATGQTVRASRGFRVLP